MRHLEKLQRQYSQIQNECSKLNRTISLQHQLLQGGGLAGLTTDRIGIFSWLRKTAAVQRKTQDLRLEMHLCEVRAVDCEKEIAAQHSLCKQLRSKHEKYALLISGEIKNQVIKNLNFEESEIEGRLSWKK
ncbi:hypothetical protein [Glaciimonas immobilis]